MYRLVIGKNIDKEKYPQGYFEVQVEIEGKKVDLDKLEILSLRPPEPNLGEAGNISLKEKVTLRKPTPLDDGISYDKLDILAMTFKNWWKAWLFCQKCENTFRRGHKVIVFVKEY